MRTPQILDHRGEPIQRAVLTQEFAAPQSFGVRQVWHPSAADNLTPVKLAGILNQAKLGHTISYLTLAEEMEERDMHYSSVLSTRKLACAGLDVRVDSLSDDNRDVEIADAVRELVTAPVFDELRIDMMDALGKGYSAVEIMWDRSGKTWKPAGYKHRDPRFFQFDRIKQSELRLRDDSDPQNGIALPAYKFIVHKPKLRSGLPIRGGLAFLCAVGYMCKAWSWKDWMAFADVFGVPMRVGKYGPNASGDDIGKLIAAVANLASDAGAVIPESMKIEFEEAASTGGAADFFERLANWWDKQVSKAVLGQTMTTDDGASLSQAKVHNDVRIDLLQYDARRSAGTLNRDLVRPFVDLNFGPGRYPNLVIPVPEPEDIPGLIDALSKLVPMGLEVEQSVIRDKLNLPDPATGKDVKLLHAPVQPAPETISPTLNRAENRESRRDREDQLVDLLSHRADPIVAEWVQQIEALVERALTLEEIRDGLIDLLPNLDEQRFGQVMQHALAIAGVAGMGDAADESYG